MLIILFFIITIMIFLYINECKYEPFENSSKYNLCIMGIFKNEELYLEEWLNHHINQGISHFYLYSNDENMHKYPYLSKYTDYITLIPWTDKVNKKDDTVQRQAYNHCVENYNNEYKYIMMLDIDEFIIPIDGKSKVIDIINSLDTDTKAIKVQRYDFGSNSHAHKPDGNVMDNYKKHEMICSSYKTIANAKYIDTKTKFFGVHDFPFKDDKGRVYNSYFDYKYKGYPNGCLLNSVNEVPLVINHYYTKSYDEYLKRCEMWKNGGINAIGYRKNCKQLFFKTDKNEVEGY